jgi:hypothetical protein
LQNKSIYSISDGIYNETYFTCKEKFEDAKGVKDERLDDKMTKRKETRYLSTMIDKI